MKVKLPGWILQPRCGQAACLGDSGNNKEGEMKDVVITDSWVEGWIMFYHKRFRLLHEAGIKKEAEESKRRIKKFEGAWDYTPAKGGK